MEWWQSLILLLTIGAVSLGTMFVAWCMFRVGGAADYYAERQKEKESYKEYDENGKK